MVSVTPICSDPTDIKMADLPEPIFAIRNINLSHEEMQTPSPLHFREYSCFGGVFKHTFFQHSEKKDDKPNNKVF
jgi:hypothetical protein